MTLDEELKKNEELANLRNDMETILIAAHKVDNEIIRKQLADIAEKWIYILKDKE